MATAKKSAAKKSARNATSAEPAAPRDRDRSRREHINVGGKKHAVRDYLNATGRSPLDPATLGDLLAIEEGSDPTAIES